MINPEIEEVNRIVRKYIDVYDFRITPDHLEFYFSILDEGSFEKNFEKLRLRLRDKNLIPLVKQNKGENVLIIVRNPPRKFFSVWINIILLLATLASTIWVGIGYYVSYYGDSGLWHNALGGFLYFSLPLMTILGVHEMGHYFAAKRHNVRVSLPFFIPAPTILGTLGAFISVREPIPDKKSLVDIGLAGPIAGFVVAIPVTLIGMFLGSINPPVVDWESTNQFLLLNVPLIYQFLSYFVPSSEFIHPMAMAGWVGFIVTAINLFPIGQLDGGHVARAIAGEKTKYVSYAFAALLFFFGIWYQGWIFFGLLVLFLGLRHPPPLNDITKLDKKRWALAISGFLLLAVTFVPVPIQLVVLQENMEISATASYTTLVEGIQNYTDIHIIVENKGEMRENASLQLSGSFLISNSSYSFHIDPGGMWENTTKIRMIEGGEFTLQINLITKTGYQKSENITILCLERSEDMEIIPNLVHQYSFNATILNHGDNKSIRFMTIDNVFFNITNSSIPVINNTIFLRENESAVLHFVVGGKTIILAMDESNYRATYLRVDV